LALIIIVNEIGGVGGAARSGLGDELKIGVLEFVAFAMAVWRLQLMA
jgi:hypothetical protein